MKRNLTYFLLLLVTEIAIAYFGFHRFIRGFLGDMLVVPLLYFLLRMLLKLSVWRTIFLTLAVAFSVEGLQYVGLVDYLKINNPVIKTIIGSHFDPWDLVAYSLGVIPILLIEKFRIHENN